MAGLIHELKRRRVFRVAGLYMVVAWLLLQVASLLEDALNLPGWFDGLVTALVLLGFPLALILAWAFELTPEGVQRTTSVSDSPAKSSALDIAMLVVLVVLAGLIVGDRLMGGSTQTNPITENPIAEGSFSIAVLPFIDLSPEGDQEYFSDGLAEELLNVLAKQSKLRVAGRTSSFAFKGKDVDIRTIAQTLNVSHVLEGSVRKSGTKIRVTAQLIKADDGFHVFSETYDRELSDIFRVQDDIAERIGGVLRMQFESSGPSGPANVEAYDLYLAARDALHTRRIKQLQEAERLLDRSVSLAPDYAPALAKKALVTMLLSDMAGGYGSRPMSEEFPKAKRLVDRALELDADLADAHAVLGLYQANSGKGDAIRSLRRALEINPNHTEAQLWLATSGPASQESFELLQGIVRRDPGFLPGVQNLVSFYGLQGKWDEADAIIARAETIPGTSEQLDRVRLGQALLKGDLVRAYRLGKSQYEQNPDPFETRLLYGYALAGLGEFQRSYDVGVPQNKMLALVELGRTKEAVDLLLSVPRSPGLLGAAATVLGTAKRYQEFADYFETFAGDPSETYIDQMLSGAIPTYVLALRKLGRDDEAKTAIQRAKAVAKRDRSNGFLDSAVRRIFHAELAAVTGDTEGAEEHLKQALQLGLAGAVATSPVLEECLSSKTAIGLRNEIYARADAARAELGWGPFERRPDGG